MYLCTMKFKIKIDWKKFLVFFVVIAGLYIITHSWLMTAGIMLLLLVADYVLADWDDTRKRRRAEKEKDQQLSENENN